MGSFFGEGFPLDDCLRQGGKAGQPRIPYLFDALLLANFLDDLEDLWQDCHVSCGEEVVGSVDVEPSKQQVGQETSYSHIGVSCTVDSVLSEILYPFRPLSPSLCDPVTAEQHSVEGKSEESVDEDMKLEGLPSTARDVVEQREDAKRDCIPQLRNLLLKSWNHKQLQDKVQGLHEKQEEDDNRLSVNFILRFVPEEVCDGFESSSFVVDFRVGIEVMAEAVHDLPLVVREASYHKEIFEVVGFMVDEVVADAYHADHQVGCDCGEGVGPLRWIFYVY